MSRRQVGVVRELWRYPVKSMLGEKLDQLTVGERGAEGDRAWALRDVASDHILTAKKWPRLLEFRSRYVASPGGGEVFIQIPGGEAVRAGDPGASEAVAAALGADARLERATPGVKSRAGIDPRTVFGDVPVEEVRPEFTSATLTDSFRLVPGTFFDSAMIHVLASGTLQHLRTLNPAGTVIDPRRFRPNIYVETEPGPGGFVEDAWCDGTLVVGDALRIVGMQPALRCVMTTHAQEDLPRDLHILRTVARHHQTNAGVFASIGSPGTVRYGDPVFLEI